MNSLFNLNVGTKVEVYYTVNHTNEERKVWWPATVHKLSYIADQRGATLSASLNFQAQYGFRASSQRLVFDTEDQVRDKDNVIYSWRLMEGSTSSSIPRPGVEDSVQDDEADQDFDPNENAPRGTKRLRNETVDIAQTAVGQESLQRSREFGAVQCNVEELQRNMRLQGEMISALQSRDNRSLTDVNEENLIPLQFLAARLHQVLEKPLAFPSRTTSRDLRGGFSFYSQDVIKKQSDCTLFQFDCLCRHIAKVCEQETHFTPPFHAVTAYPQNVVQIDFYSVSAFLKLFTTLSRNSTREVFIKAKTDRTSGAVVGMRILGCVFQNETNPDVPMVITVGTSISRNAGDEEASHVILRRENTSWDDLEENFRSPLELSNVKASDVLSLCEGTMGEEDFRKHCEKYSCSMTWRRESHLDSDRLALNAPNPKHVLGVLDLTIPCVHVRQAQCCSELSSILSTVDLASL